MLSKESHSHAQLLVAILTQMETNVPFNSQALKYNTVVAWHKYRQLRNKATALLRSAKSSYYHRLADEIHQQPHRFWKEFCHLSNKKIQSSDPSPPHSAKEFNDHFLNIANHLCSVIPQQSIDPTSYLSSLCNTHISNLEITTVGEDVVTKLLSELDHHTLTGHDGLPPKFLKICALFITKPLTHIVNRRLQETEMPSLWKSANVTPIHKGGSTERQTIVLYLFYLPSLKF